MRSIFMAGLVGLRRLRACHDPGHLASAAEVWQESRMLSERQARFLASCRVGHLATADARATPHLVPVCFVVSNGALYITIDQKPKGNVKGLKRLRNIIENPVASFVADRWDEDWARLGWVMLHGPAEILADGAEHDRAQTLLRARYPQYRGMVLDDLPVIALRIERVTSWGNLSVEPSPNRG
jgi:PPOX class probable F420-dependent enzyme